MKKTLLYRGIRYRFGRFRHLINGRATEWDRRTLRILAEDDLQTRIDELNYEMYKLSLKEAQRETSSE